MAGIFNTSVGVLQSPLLPHAEAGNPVSDAQCRGMGGGCWITEVWEHLVGVSATDTLEGFYQQPGGTCSLPVTCCYACTVRPRLVQDPHRMLLAL